jgi:ornithine carbamoyltransferase
LSVKHLLGLDDFKREEVDSMLELAKNLKQELKEGKKSTSLCGKSVAMIFEKSSTRTRVSFEVGITQLGGYPLFLSGKELQLSRGEPIKDTGRVLSRYVNAIVIRARRHEDVVELANNSSVPVINGLTDLLHPCQILADLLTLKEAGHDLDNMIVTFVGDGNNVANSWINAAAIYNFDLRIACPKGYDPNGGVLKRAKENGASVEIIRDPLAAVKDSDVLYTDVWVSMGQEEEKAKRLKDFDGFQINIDLVDMAAPEVKVLHCLPAHRDEEITDEVLEGPHSLIFDEAENRLHVQKSVLEILVKKP